MDQQAAQAQQDAEPTPAPDPTTDDAPAADRRVAVFDEIDQARREMLRENGIDLEEAPEGGGQEGQGPDAQAGDGQGTDAGDQGAAVEQDHQGDGAAAAQADAEGGDQQQGADQPATDPEDPDQQLVTVVGEGGREFQVPMGELKRTYSIEQAARTRLEEANRLLEQARAAQPQPPADAGEPAQQGQDPAAQPAAQPSEGAVAEALRDIDFEQYAKDIQYGDEKESAAALAKAVGDAAQRVVDRLGVNGQQNQPSVEDIERGVWDKIQFNQAQERFGTEYEDIVRDPALAHLAWSTAKALYSHAYEEHRQNGTPMPSYHDVFTQAGERMRAWAKGLASSFGDGAAAAADDPRGQQPKPQQGQPEVTVDVKGRTDAKRSHQPPEPRGSQPAGGGGGGRAPATAAEARTDPSKTIGEMAASRKGMTATT